MQQPDMRVGTRDHLAVHLQHQAEHAVRGGMLRPEIQRMAVDLDGLETRLALRRVRLQGIGNILAQDDAAHLVPPAVGVVPAVLGFCLFSCAFSSPGRVSTPSQGDSKSKWRKSWVSFTGS